MNKSYRDILDSVASPHISDDLNLFPHVVARLNQRKTFMQTLRARPSLAMILALLALLLLTGVAYAIGRLTGFIPGVGFVQTNSLRVLAEPVSQTRDGITVSIEQVVVDTERTIIIYKTEGLTIQAANSKGEGGGPFGSPNLLRLPDGTTFEESREFNGTPEPLLNSITTEGGWPNYVQRLVYRSVPPEMNELTLIIPVLQNMPVGAAPENWEIPFNLKPAPADMNYAPIIEFTPVPSEATTDTPVTGETSAPALSSTAVKNGLTLQLDNVIELEDGFVFTGNLSWDDSAFPAGKDIFPEAARLVLTDANGQEVPIEEVPLGWSSQKNKLSWSYRTNSKALTGPLTLSVSSVKATVLAPPADLQIDLGPNPQVGQTWEVNQDFVFNGHVIRLSSVQLNGDCAPQMSSLIFNFTSDLAGADGFINDLAPQEPFDYSCEGGGMWPEGRPVASTNFSVGIPYGMIPSGMRQFTVNLSLPYMVEGPWQVTWTPPLTSEPTATPATGACLTLDIWNQLINRNDPLPAGLVGQVIMTVDEGWRLPGIHISKLDGTNSRKIDMGAWPSLSTDGTRLAYSIDDGIHIFNLASGENPALGMDGYRIIWSPDNSRLMYTTTFTLNVVNADGTGLQQVNIGSAQVIAPSGWLPDNQTVVFSTMGGDGFTFKTHNLQSGKAKELFTIQNKAGYGAVSPDGQWLVFADRVFGANNWGIFISRLDGSDRRQVVGTEIPTAFTSVWGPDGQWLIVNTTKQDGTMTPVLVNPFTCQVARLGNFNGMIEGWSR